MPDGADAGFGRDPEDLFLDALDLSPADRSSFLDDACQGDLALRAEVESMLGIADANPQLLVPPEIGLIPAELGRYQVLDELGRGGMGIVFKARDTRLLRTVALKVLPHYLSQESRNLERFTREAQLLARLNHPNIATLHSLDRSDGFHFLTMEYVEGMTLSEILAERCLSLQESLSLALQVTLALESAHALGVCHCDLKPANIMVAPDGKVSLLDFGIARAFGNLEATPAQSAGLTSPALTRASGTPGYMAPEQAAGQPVDERGDLWALGVVLFECLTGTAVPWHATGPVVDWQRQLPGHPPRSLVALMKSCLEPDPEVRLSTAAESRTVLESLLRRQATSRRRLIGAAGLVTMAAVAAWLLVPRGATGPVVQLQNRDDVTLVATNDQGQTLWTRQLEALRVRHPVVLRMAAPGPEDSRRRAVTGSAVIVDVATYTGHMEFLSPIDGRTIWSRQPAWTVPVNAHGPSNHAWLTATRWPGQRSEVLLAGVRDGPWYGFAVECIDTDGRELGIYHHPGVLTYLVETDAAEQDHGPILFGSNSSARFDRTLVPFETAEHVGCVVQLDPADISGQAHPYSRDLPEERDWPGMPEAREKTYLLIPPIDSSCGSRVDRVVAGRSQSGQRRYTAFLIDGRVVLLDQQLFPLEAQIGVDSQVEELVQAGQARNLPYLYIRHGNRQWVDVALKY